eukprot:COSAG01_NODE_711_length_14105_cov_5.661145_12_plen_119_part_00
MGKREVAALEGILYGEGIGAQFIPGVDAVVDATTAGVETADAVAGAEEGTSAAEEAASRGQRRPPPADDRARAAPGVDGGPGLDALTYDRSIGLSASRCLRNEPTRIQSSQLQSSETS